MIRALIALGTLTALSAPAPAQPGRLPLAPGVMPGSPIGPGTQFLPPSQPRFGPGISMSGAFNVGRFGPGFSYARSGFGYGFGYGYGYGGGYGYGYDAPPVVIQVVAPAPQQRPDPVVVLANEFPATLTVQFPAPADVWLDGQKLPGAADAERVLTSPVLKANGQYTFAVRARWSSGGKTFEAKRSVTLAVGDRSRLYVISGDEVKD